MASNVEVNLIAKTSDFEDKMTKATKTFEALAFKGADSNKALSKSFEQLNKIASSELSDLQKAFNALQVKGDFGIGVQKDKIAEAKRFYIQQFNEIRNSAETSAAETERAWTGLKNAFSNINKANGVGSSGDSNFKVQMQAQQEANTMNDKFNDMRLRSDAKMHEEALRLNQKFNAEKLQSEIKMQEEAYRLNAEFNARKIASDKALAIAKMNALGEAFVKENEMLANAYRMNAEFDAKKIANNRAAAVAKMNALGDAFVKENEMLASAYRMNAEFNAKKILNDETSLRKMTLLHAEANAMNAKFNAGVGETAAAAKEVGNGISGWSLASVMAIAKIQILYSIINNIMSAVASTPGVAAKAIEDFNSAAITNAALITSMQGNVGDVGKRYQENKVYALAVQEVLVKMDAETSASAQNLSDMNRAFIAQGVILDSNNKKQVEGFKNTANAIEALTHGNSNQAMQYTQEVKSMLKGEDRAGNQLFQALNGMDNGKLKEHLDEWQKIAKETGNYGYVLEKIGPMLQGFAAAQGDINNLWSTTKSTMATIRDDILRGGLAPAFAEIVSGMKEISKWAEDNKVAIRAYLRDSFRDIKIVVTTMWEFRDAIKAGAELALWVGIATGIGSVILKLEAMRTSIVAINLATGSGFLPKLLALGGGAVVGVGGMIAGAGIIGKGLYDERTAAAEGRSIASHLGNTPEANALQSGQAMMWMRQQKGHEMDSALKLQQLIQSGVFKAIGKNDGGENDSPYDAYTDYRLTLDKTKEALFNSKINGIKPPKNLKTGGGSETENADYTDRWNAYVDSLRSFENKGEGNSYEGQIKKISESLDNLKAAYNGLDSAHKKLSDNLHGGSSIKYFESLAKTAKDTAWYLNSQKETTEGLNQVASEKALFNINNMNGDLSTDRYKVTPLSEYRLRTNNTYSIPQDGKDLEAEIEASKKMQHIKIQLDRELLATKQSEGDQRRALEVIRINDELENKITEIEAIKNLNGDLISAEQQKWDLMLQAEEVYNARKKQLTETNWTAVGNIVGDNLGKVGDMLMKGNKEQFEAGKKFAIASAMINTYMAASSAFAGGVKAAPGPWGVALGIASAAIAVAAGMTQVAAIDSQQYQAREFGGPVTAGQSYIVGEKRPELFTPGASGTITPYVPQGGGGTTSITQVIQVSTGVADTVRSEIGKMLPMLRAQAVSAVAQAQRGGQMQLA